MADILKSVDVPTVHGMVVLNPDGSTLGTPVGGATSSNQTDGSQKTQIVDAGGEAVTVTGGKLDVNATASLAGASVPISGATEAVGVAIVDGSGNQITSFGGGTQYTEGDIDASITGTAMLWEDAANTLVTVSSTKPLPVSASIDTTGLATTTTDTNTGTIAGDTTSIDSKIPALGQALAAASVPVVLPASQITTLTPPAAITGFATSAKQDTGNTSIASIDSKIPALGQALAAASVPVILPSATITTLTPPAAITNFANETGGNLAAIKAKTDNIPAQGQALAAASLPVVLPATQITTLTPLSTVAVTNADLTTLAGAVSATHMQADIVGSLPAGSALIGKVGIDQTTPGTTNKVTVGSDVVHTIVDSGAVTATLAAETTKVIGTVNQGTSPWVTSNATTSVVGNGAAATAQRVTLANDSTGTVAATLAAETTKVIGTVRNGDGAGNLWTSNSTTYTAKFGQDSNLLGTLGTAFSTAGKVDVKVASGDIASGAIASGAIAAGAIAAGNTSIATTEDTARAAGEHLVKVGLSRLDTPVANANVSTDGDYTNFIADNFGKLWVAGTVPEDTAHVAGEALNINGVRRIDTPAVSSGTSGDWSTMDASAEGALWATLTPTTTGGCSLFRSIDLDETEEDVKTSAGNLYGYYFANTTASARYLKLYNATAANTTVGTTTPVATFYMPPTSAGHVGLAFPISFSTAICAAATTGVADNDTGAPGVSDVIFMAFYK